MEKTLSFLKEISSNNNREWFQANRERYERSQEEMILFASTVLQKMSKIDVISTSSGKSSLHRIYRDVRFKKDKTPYKTNRSGFFTRAGEERRGGYYFSISPEESYVMGGFFGPNSADLLHIRKQIDAFSDPLRKVLESSEFISFFGSLRGDQLKTSPRGFAKNHPEIELLRYKQFILRKDFTQSQVKAKDFDQKMTEAFEKMLPFLTVMTEYLTTDLNGESLL